MPTFCDKACSPAIDNKKAAIMEECLRMDEGLNMKGAHFCTDKAK